MLNLSESRRHLASLLRCETPFVFTKFGDAEIMWITGCGHGMAERELCTPMKAAELTLAWGYFGEIGERLKLGDWRSASFGPAGVEFPDEYERMLRSMAKRPAETLHYETTLSMVLDDTLLDFYTAIAQDKRRKLYVGPRASLDQGAHKMLDADAFEAPWENSCDGALDRGRQIVDWPYEVVIFAAGRGSKISMGYIAMERPEITLIDIGSGLDPVFLGRTRSQQAEPSRARGFFRSLL